MMGQTEVGGVAVRRGQRQVAPLRELYDDCARQLLRDVLQRLVQLGCVQVGADCRRRPTDLPPIVVRRLLWQGEGNKAGPRTGGSANHRPAGLQRRRPGLDPRGGGPGPISDRATGQIGRER